MKKLTKIYLNKSKNNMVMSKKLSSIGHLFPQHILKDPGYW